MVDLVRAGRSPVDLAREFEPTARSIRTWAVQADKQESRREEAVPGLAAAERDRLVRLRRENRQLRVERDILPRAAAGIQQLIQRTLNYPVYPVLMLGVGWQF